MKCKCKNDKCINCGSYFFPKKSETKLNVAIWALAICLLVVAVILSSNAYECEVNGGTFVGAMFDSQCVGVDE